MYCKVLPTFAALAGAPLPTDREFDGHDLAPLLFAEDDEASDGSNESKSASREPQISLYIYMIHLYIIYDAILIVSCLRRATESPRAPPSGR